MEERDAEMSSSPGFRWGTTLLPGDEITVEDLYTRLRMTYPRPTGWNAREADQGYPRGRRDNLFNKDPYFQQGGDMVRVGGMGYAMRPNEKIGGRISNMTYLKTGKAIDPAKEYGSPAGLRSTRARKDPRSAT